MKAKLQAPYLVYFDKLVLLNLRRKLRKYLSDKYNCLSHLNPITPCLSAEAYFWIICRVATVSIVCAICFQLNGDFTKKVSDNEFNMKTRYVCLGSVLYSKRSPRGLSRGGLHVYTPCFLKETARVT